MKTRLFVASAVLVSFAACTSALKKKCRETNWFQHGFDFAMTGQRLNADSFKDQCYKEDVNVNEAELDRGFKAGMANYCKPESALAHGKKGEVLSLELCDGQLATVLTKKHQEGIESYCTLSGYSAGASGAVYKQVCPSALEPAFLKEYRRGRKVYLSNRIAGAEQKITADEGKVADLRRKTQQLGHRERAAELRANRVVRSQFANDAQFQSAKQNADQERQSIGRELRRTESEIQKVRRQQDEAREEITKLRTERDSLE